MNLSFYRFIILSFCLSIISFLFSCDTKTIDYGFDNYYVEIVTAQNENTFLSDKGHLIVASNDNKKTYLFGDRVLINYTLLSSPTLETNNIVRINGSSKIPSGKVTLTNDSTIRFTNNEPVRLESVWLGSHYLNLRFYFNYKSETHKIGLLTDSSQVRSDTLRMYFVHDSNNDPPGYPVQVYISYDLKDLLGVPQSGRPISVQILSSNYGNKNYEFRY